MQSCEPQTLQRLWHVDCPSLPKITDPNMILRHWDVGYPLRSKLVYSCIHGYELSNGNKTLEFECSKDGTWQSELVDWNKATCVSQDTKCMILESTVESSRIPRLLFSSYVPLYDNYATGLFAPYTALQGSSLRLECPLGQGFLINTTRSLDAECQSNGCVGCKERSNNSYL